MASSVRQTPGPRRHGRGSIIPARLIALAMWPFRRTRAGRPTRAVAAGGSPTREDERRRGLLAVSRMAVECAAAPKGTDPLRLIGDQIHAVTGAVGTIVSTFDEERSELRVHHVVAPAALRAIGERIIGQRVIGTVVPVPRGWGEEVLRGSMESADLTYLTFGRFPAAIETALKVALNIERFTGIGLSDGQRVFAAVLVGLPPGAPPLDPQVVDIFSKVATMLLRQKEAEEKTRDTESRFTDMVDGLPQPVFELDRRGSILFANATARSVFGVPSREARHAPPLLQIVAPQDRRAAFSEFVALRAGRSQKRFHFTFVRADGTPFPAVVTASPILRDGRVTGVRGVVGDLSLVQRAEQRARDSQQMLQLVLDLIPQTIFWKDRSSVYLGCNLVFAKRCGRPDPSAVVGLTDDDMPWRQEAERYREIDRQVMESGVPRLDYSQTMVTSRGVDRSVRLSKLPLRDSAGVLLGVLGISEDVTERMRSDEERRLLGAAVDQAVESVVITDTAGAIQYVNPAFLGAFGYPREDVLGANPRLLKSGRHDEAFYRQMWDTIGDGQVWRGRLHNRRRDGSVLIEDAIISPVREAGGTSHYVKVARDVTYEVELEGRFQQAQKMEAVGRLAGGVAHDFNNILTVISGYGELLSQAGAGMPGGWREEIAAINEAADRARGLTAQLLAFSRKQKLEPAVIELDAVLRGIEPMLRRLIGEDIALGLTLESSRSTVFVDRGQIEQVILNLVVNARDAMPHGGRLTLRTRRQRIDAQGLGARDARPGDYAILEVQDTGTGMTEEVKAHLFEPFFTTKPEHEGTGLGLATVYGIVAQSGGFIEVDSTLNRGATFRILLPIRDTAEAAPAAAGPSAAARGSQERVLLVEDDTPIRVLLRRSLEDGGFVVTDAPNAAQALQIARAHAGRFQLLVTDVVMPNGSGPALAETLRREQPEIKVLFISGYTAHETEKYGIAAGELNLLQKPFSMRELARRARETLDRP